VLHDKIAIALRDMEKLSEELGLEIKTVLKKCDDSAKAHRDKARAVTKQQKKKLGELVNK